MHGNGKQDEIERRSSKAAKQAFALSFSYAHLVHFHRNKEEDVETLFLAPRFVDRTYLFASGLTQPNTEHRKLQAEHQVSLPPWLASIHTPSPVAQWARLYAFVVPVWICYYCVSSSWITAAAFSS